MGIYGKNVSKVSAKELRERSDKAFDEQQKYNAQLVEALKNGKLKSKRLIAEAEALCNKSK